MCGSFLIIIRVRCYRVSNTNTYIPDDVCIVNNIFLNSYTLYECTYLCITCSVTAHPDDGQARSKHAGVTN